MQADALNGLDYSRHLRWLRRVTGADYDFAVCAPDGSVVWAGRQDSDIGAWIAALCAGGFAWSCVGEGMQRHDGGAGGDTLLYLAIRGKTGLLGYLAVRTAAAAGAPVAWDELAETLEDIGAGIADECAAKRELDSMALELSERYEELHLVYAIDKTVQQLEPGADLFQRLLQSWAEHMDADVAAFVKPGENLCTRPTCRHRSTLSTWCWSRCAGTCTALRIRRVRRSSSTTRTIRAAPISSPTCRSSCCAAR
jgi:hypothetical protein